MSHVTTIHINLTTVNDRAICSADMRSLDEILDRHFGKTRPEPVVEIHTTAEADGTHYTHNLLVGTFELADPLCKKLMSHLHGRLKHLSPVVFADFNVPFTAFIAHNNTSKYEGKGDVYADVYQDGCHWQQGDYIDGKHVQEAA